MTGQGFFRDGSRNVVTGKEGISVRFTRTEEAVVPGHGPVMNSRSVYVTCDRRSGRESRGFPEEREETGQTKKGRGCSTLEALPLLG